MFLALITFFSGLAISAVAIYYSVIGLAAIFAAAVIPIIVMGSILEVSKLVAAWWLKANWHRAPFLLKSYMLLAVIVLMLITSMGIFGFLSKAHTEQAVPVGDNMATIQIIDERIAIEQEVIAQARQDIDVLNQQIERFTELGAVSRGVTARNQQREERQALTQQVIQAQERISEMRAERAPFAASLRAIEAEVGPIKYIAKLIYGDSTDANMLEQAVVWIIIVIVFVFDPLAVLLLLASQLSFKWAREEREQQAQAAIVPPAYEPDDGPLSEEQINQIRESIEETQPVAEPAPVVEPRFEQSEVIEPPAEPTVEQELDDKQELDRLAEELLIYVEDDEELMECIEDDEEELEIIERAERKEKAAMQRWKSELPNRCVKHQRHLLEAGIITQLPWTQYIEPDEIDEPTEDQSAAIEAARWAEEQLDAAKKKVSDVDGESGGQTDQENSRRLAGYVQNSEQSTDTIWQRIKKAKE